MVGIDPRLMDASRNALPRGVKGSIWLAHSPWRDGVAVRPYEPKYARIDGYSTADGETNRVTTCNWDARFRRFAAREG